jgi:hypothetical protein
MSDIERFQQEGRAATRKFFEDVRGFVDHMLYLLEDRLGPYSDAFNDAVLESTSSAMGTWRADFEELTRKQQGLKAVPSSKVFMWWAGTP